MKMNIQQVWLFTFVVFFFAAFGLGVVLANSFAVFSGMGLVIGLAIFAFFGVSTLIKGYFETPNGNVDIIESFGQYIGEIKKPGPHLLYPYFNLEIIRARVFMGQQKLDLHLSKDSVESGDVEFRDCSSSINATLFFKIYDPEKAVYGINDLLGSLEEKAGHMLRSFFGMYTLDEAITLKSFFKIESVACILDISISSSVGKKTVEDFQGYQPSKEDVEKTQFFEIIKSWGVEPVAIIVSDIDVPEDIKKQRSRKLTAEKDKEVAEIEISTAEYRAEKMEIDAAAEANKIAMLGGGQSDALWQIVFKSGLPKEKVTEYLIQTKKWEALGNNANVTIIEGSDTVSEGVKLGVGMSAGSKKK